MPRIKQAGIKRNDELDKLRIPPIETLEQKLERQARILGGGWRIEHGVMPIIVLNSDEAQRVIDRLKVDK